MDFVLPDPLQASDDAISASPPSLSTSPAMTSDYTSLIDSVMRDEDIEALLGDDSLTWDFILAQPSSPSASSAAASGPPLTPPRSVSQSRRESLASSVPSELRSEEPYEVADASIMTSVGPISSVSLLSSSTQSQDLREGLLIHLDEEVPAFEVPPLALAPSLAPTENLVQASGFGLPAPSVVPPTKSSQYIAILRCIPWRLLFIAAFESATGFDPAYVELPIRMIDLTAELDVPARLPASFETAFEASARRPAESMQVGGWVPVTFAVVVLLATWIVRRKPRTSTAPPPVPRPVRVAPRNAAPTSVATPRQTVLPKSARAARALRAPLAAQATQVTLEDPSLFVNVCLFGAPGVGVSSLIARQVWDADADDCDWSDSAVGYRQSYKRRGAPTVFLTLCDWSDDRTRTQIGRHGLHVALVVFGLDDQGSFAEAQQKVRQIRQAGVETGSLRAIHLVANKADLLGSAGPAKSVRLQHTRRRAADWARDEGLLLHEVEALDKLSVEDLFRSVARDVRTSATAGKAGRA